MRKSKNGETPPHILANTLKEKAIQLSKSFQYKESYELFKQSSKIWKELGDLRRSEIMMASALHNKARSYRKERNFEKYRKYLMKSANKWNNLGILDNELWCLAYYNQSMANTMRQENNFVKEREYFLKATDIWNELGIKKNALRCQANYNQSMAKTMRQNNNLVKEREYEMKAFNIWNELGIEKNALRCQANYYVSFAVERYLNNNVESTIDYYEKAKQIYLDIDERHNALWCEARIYTTISYIMSDYYEFFEASNLKFQASEKYKDAGILKESLSIEAQAWSELATFYKRNNNYDESINNFKKASKIFNQIKEQALYNWCMGNVSECLYFKSKYGGSIKLIIKHLKDAIYLFENGNDITAANILKGDLYKYEGFFLTSKGNLKEALNKFLLSKECFNKAYLELSGSKSAILQQKSIIYTESLIKYTTAHIEFINNINPKLAKKYYEEASELFKLSEDYINYEHCNNLHYLCKALDNALEGKYDEALMSWSKVSNIYNKLITKPFPKNFNLNKMIGLISVFTKLIVKQADESIKELIDSDKGPSFESRVRELINKFDGREYEDIKGDIFNLGSNYKIILHKYYDVKELNAKPKMDEIGVVFDDETPINIDVLGKRIIKDRTYLIICECKNRPNYNITIKDIELFNKKSKFVRIRYNKIENLNSRKKPVIEEMWYFSTGNYTKEAITYSNNNNIKLINKIGISKLLKEFGFKKL